MVSEFGKKGKDVVTGFSGRIIGWCQYSTGCSQVLLSPEIAKDGTFRSSQWFDKQRIKVLPGRALKLENGATPGCDLTAPVA